MARNLLTPNQIRGILEDYIPKIHKKYTFYEAELNEVPAVEPDGATTWQVDLYDTEENRSHALGFQIVDHNDLTSPHVVFTTLVDKKEYLDTFGFISAYFKKIGFTVIQMENA